MEGIIYKVQPYQEHARLLFVYTKIGKKTLLAQGSQKLNHPNRILAQYLTQIEFKDQDKSFLTLSEAKIINDYEEIKEDYKLTKSAALMLEIIDTLIVDSYDHQEIYQSLIKALQSKQLEIATLSFALKILRPLGYPLDLNADGRKVLGVNIEKGGLVYQGDSDIIDLDVKESIVLLKMNFIPYQDLEAYEIETIAKIKEFILKYYQYHLQSTLKNLQ
ncbi:MAG: DNA repair protein RecO [Acholeplasmataceae bacterium]|nr:DNA repair protein RecO [Acholeplasmataceae bacterium]